jgi:hypothetical protein
LSGYFQEDLLKEPVAHPKSSLKISYRNNQNQYVDDKNCIKGAAINAANPNDMIEIPVAKPLFSGKYLTSVDTGVI